MKKQATAVVCGAGVAGLLAARVCSERFERVVVVERDRPPTADEPRPGVPQGRHLHVLLLRGKQILEELFPGFCKEVVEAGGLEIEQGSELLLFNKFGNWAPRKPTGNTSLNASRPLLEGVLRRMLPPGIQWHCEAEVTGLLWSEDHSQVTGVQLHHRQTGEDERLFADLVIDASGSRSHLPQWLEDAGYGKVRESRVNSFTGYASRLYAIPDDFRDTWKWMLLWNQPPHIPRSGHVFQIEGGRWLVSLMGMGRQYPPTDEEGFLEFARSLSHPHLYETIKEARPLSPISGYRDTQNALRHYEALSRWPGRLLALGDAVCCFNPSYGQGMTVSAQTAQLLARCLADCEPDGVGREFQKRLARQNQGPWMMATGEEVRWPETEGATANAWTRIQHAYVDKVAWLTQSMELASTRYGQVVNLTRSPAALFHPLIVLAVLFWPRKTHPADRALPAPPAAYQEPH